MLSSVSERTVRPAEAGIVGEQPSIVEPAPSTRDRVERGSYLRGNAVTGSAALSQPLGLRVSAVSGTPAVDAAKDRDPVEHIRVLSSDEMQGRDSPSPGLDAAAKYISDFAKRYGLSGANPEDPVSPYYQTFNTFRFSEPDHHDGALKQHTLMDRPRLFEYGFSASPGCTKEDMDLLIGRMDDRNPDAAAKLRRLVETTSEKDMALALANEFEMRGRVQNVVAKLEGTGPHKDEVIVVMAHYDHVGTRFGQVYNGADDNASGSAALMAAIPDLVEAQKRGELDRSIVFLWTAAEEKGLVGAHHYVRNPIPGAGLEEIVGVVNVDMLGRWDAERLSVTTKTGREENYFAGLVHDANESMDDPFGTINRDIDFARNRQDGWAFTRAGEDVAVIFEGLSNANGGGDMNPDYHRTTDTLDAMLAENGGEKIRKGTEFLRRLLQLAANREAESDSAQ